QQRVIKRLLAEAVAGEEQRLLGCVPQGEGEHAAKAREAVLAPFLPGMNDDLGIAMGTETMPLSRELGHEFAGIINLAIEGDGNRAVLVEQRLLPMRDIDDGEAPVAESDAGGDMKTAAVGAAMRDAVGHAAEERPVDRAPPPYVHDPGNPAHRSNPSYRM